MRLRILPNGYGFYPKRGTPPAAPNGYMNTDDPFVFAPILAPCDFRIINKEVECQDCGNTKKVTWCNRDNKKVLHGKCFICQGGGDDYV